MVTDKNQAIINFLQTCPELLNGSVFFNFADVKDMVHQVVTEANDIALHQPYIDGSVLKRYTFTIVSFKSVSFNPLTTVGYIDENVSDMAEVQSIVDWINENADNFIFPDFGDDCVIEEMETLTDNPDLFGIDTKSNPPIAKYGISIRIQYLDKSKMIWN